MSDFVLKKDLPFAKKGDQIVDARGGIPNPLINIMCYVKSRLILPQEYIYLGTKEDLLKEDWILEQKQ